MTCKTYSSVILKKTEKKGAIPVDYWGSQLLLATTQNVYFSLKL